MNTKRIIFLSGIAGLICAPLCLIPFVKSFIFLFLVFLIGAVISFYLVRFKFLPDFDFKKAMTVGSIVGAVSFFAFCLLFVPLVLIISKFLPGFYTYGIPYITNFSGFWLLVVIVAMLSGVSALINSVGALAVSYFCDLIKTKDFKTELNNGKDNRMD